MASYRLRRTEEDGSKVYQIRAAHKRGQGAKSITWTAPAGWSQKSIYKQLEKLGAELDRQYASGEIMTRTEQKEKAEADAAEAAKIKTVHQYGDSVYIPYKQTECAVPSLRQSHAPCA